MCEIVAINCLKQDKPQLKSRTGLRMEGQGRKWEDMNTDCLVEIFERLDTGSLMLDVPLVCKSWYKVSADPQSWKVLDFMSVVDRRALLHKVDDTQRGFVPTFRLVKFVVDRSQRMANKVVVGKFWKGMEKEFELIMHYISQECPALRTLVLPEQHRYLGISKELMNCIPQLIIKWKGLESLRINNYCNLKEVLTQIHTHCKSFSALATGKFLDSEAALAIPALVPNIKYLELSGANLPRENLLLILSKCKSLEVLDVRGCVGFDADDAEISNMASHIQIFMPEGSKLTCFDDLVDLYFNYGI